eukprot:3065461-Amphidinium_carterae.1
MSVMLADGLPLVFYVGHFWGVLYFRSHRRKEQQKHWYGVVCHPHHDIAMLGKKIAEKALLGVEGCAGLPAGHHFSTSDV